jgi:prevent-host-death family protein
MDSKTIGAADFKAKCLRIIEQMNQDHEPVTITKHGRPVARLLPIAARDEGVSIVGAMKGSVLRYDRPFGPAVEASEWTATT